MTTWYATIKSPPPLTMVIGKLVNLKKTSEMFPINGQFLASYSKLILTENWKNSAIKFAIQGPILPVFVKPLSQIFSEGLLAIPINKVQSSSNT